MDSHISTEFRALQKLEILSGIFRYFYGKCGKITRGCFPDVETLLDNMNPYPQHNSVIVMDNASTHHFDGIREIIEARCVLLFDPLPPQC
ncbi:hypothetical protein C8R45DRAFT_832487 [Mycena sanguinolenta]|nr:hypothetical protein C8R45DRAFT_832487 [Mycena sanguinolenta]